MSEDLTQNQLPDFKAQNEPIGTQTTSSGNPTPYPTASKTVGKNGPILVEDWELFDGLQHFVRERVPERVVHAKGSAAFGYFEVTKDITQYTVAKVFEKIGKRTPIAIRFSTVAGHMGSADTVRDPRGFAVKFYGEEGNWDLVGNNTPIFFVRDPIMFPYFIHSQKENPQTGVRDVNAFWDFIGQRPETTHQVMFLFSDRGIPDGYRYMHGFGSHTFVFVNAKEKKYYVKFHYRTDQGIKNLPVKDAAILAGQDADYSRRDLYNAIASGKFPSWTLYIQIMTEDQANAFPFNPFDVTKVWPHGDYPLMEVGKLVLNKNPENHFAEVEQLAFSPANMPPGIYASYDRMLQGRLFSYHDAHIYRLGANYSQLPVNCPFRVKNNQRDGAAVFNSQGGAPNYVPNRFGGPTPNLKARTYYPIVDLNGKAKNWDTSTTEDNFKQPRDFYRMVLKEEERKRLADNIGNHMRNATAEVRRLAIKNFTDVDDDLGNKITAAIKSKATANI